MNDSVRACQLALVVAVIGVGSAAMAASQNQAGGKRTKADAERMIAAAEGTLAPVYAPLAQEMAKTLGLAGKTGVGIDLGSGPGTLIVELCKHTTLHWVNADINPHFFPYFMQKADMMGFGGRVSAVRADAQDLPFRTDYADVIVSRGSFHFWPDKRKAFGEIHRVLKPGGVACIGRGFSSTLPAETARAIRSKQGKGIKYDVDKAEQELRDIMQRLGITDYRIIRPRPAGAEGINYGIWLQWRKASPF